MSLKFLHGYRIDLELSIVFFLITTMGKKPLGITSHKPCLAAEVFVGLLINHT